MGGIILGNEAGAYDYIDGFVGDIIDKQFEVMSYAGDFFQKHARENKRFNDVTGNLKNSINYAVAIKGRIAEKGDSAGGKAQSETNEGLRDIVAGISEEIALIGIAGMHYGLYVENMEGKSVIYQSIDAVEKLIENLLSE